MLAPTTQEDEKQWLKDVDECLARHARNQLTVSVCTMQNMRVCACVTMSLLYVSQVKGSATEAFAHADIYDSDSD